MPSERCKLPAYVPHDPLLWFRAVEANFNIHKVLTEKDRASLTIAALPERQLQSVGDLLDVPPSDLYSAIKGRLLTVDAPTFQDSWERCLLLPVMRAGEKPTDVHRILTSWLTGHDPEDPFLRATFLQKMPGDLKRMLLARTDCTLAQLAAFADTIHSCAVRAPVVNRLETSRAFRTTAPGLSEEVPVAVDSDCNLPTVCAVSAAPVPSRRPAAAAGRPSAAPPAGGASSTQRHSGGYCWYHGRFGVNACACKPGCTWQKNAFSPGQ